MPDRDPQLLAIKCRSLASQMSDEEAVRALNRLAEEYEARTRIAEQTAAWAQSQGREPPQ
jgi:hypothetical protein